MRVTTLHEKPSGEPCQACATLRFERTMAYFDHLAVAVERLNAARSLSRQLRALVEEATTLTALPAAGRFHNYRFGAGSPRQSLRCHRHPEADF